jgi:hypothetical protein
MGNSFFPLINVELAPRAYVALSRRAGEGSGGGTVMARFMIGCGTLAMTVGSVLLCTACTISVRAGMAACPFTSTRIKMLVRSGI